MYLSTVTWIKYGRIGESAAINTVKNAAHKNCRRYGRTYCSTLPNNLVSKAFPVTAAMFGVWGLGFGVWGLGFGVNLCLKFLFLG